MRTSIKKRSMIARRGMGMVMLCLVGWSSLAARASLAQRPDADAGVMILDEGWQYRWGDSPLDEQGVPVWTYDARSAAGWQPTASTFNPPGVADHMLWLRVRLPDPVPDNAALFTFMVTLTFEVYLDSTRIYQVGELVPHSSNRFAVTTLRSIPLPAGASGRMLYFRIYSEYTELIGIPNSVYLSSGTGVPATVLRTELDDLILGIIFTFVALIALFLAVQGRQEDVALPAFYISLFTFSIGVHLLTESGISRLTIAAPVLWYYLFWGAAYLTPVGFIAFFEQVIGSGYRAIIRRLWQAHLVLGVVALLLDSVGVFYMPRLVRPFLLLFTISILAMIVTVVPAVRKGSREARIFVVGFLLAAAAGLYDVVFVGFVFNLDRSQISSWGILILMFCLAYILMYRYTENTRQLRAAHARLEEYSTTLEQKVEARTHDLHEKNEALSRTLGELKTAQDHLIHAEKMASLGSLTAGIAHEIKNPLNFINNFSQLSVELADELVQELEANQGRPLAEVLDDVQDLLADLKTNAEKIREHGQRADGIVRSMLEHSRSSAGERRAVDVNGLLDEYLQLAYHGMRASTLDFNVTMEKDLDASVGAVEMAPQEIGRVFINLLNNAFYAVRERSRSSDGSYAPTVEVRTRRDGDSVEIRVRDNGPGIATDFQEKIFEPFFTTKPTGSGTGLGLSLSYDIVTRGHGGTLTVESAEGEGATFVITLPA